MYIQKQVGKIVLHCKALFWSVNFEVNYLLNLQAKHKHKPISTMCEVGKA